MRGAACRRQCRAAEVNRRRLTIEADYAPAGDQPEAARRLADGVARGKHDQVLLGVTGSGKTFTMAQIIEKLQKPALVMAHNKTLAAQLYAEMKGFFPHNAVEYFVSYYDYYQPEAYVPRTDTYISKDSDVNQQIDRLRHAATRSLLERRDVIIVASVSCLFGIGSVETYSDMLLDIRRGQNLDIRDAAKRLAAMQYKRVTADFKRGSFRITGDCLDIYPVHLEDCAWRIEFFGDIVETISSFDPLTLKQVKNHETIYEHQSGQWLDGDSAIRVYPNSHYVTPRPTMLRAIEGIKNELRERLAFFEAEQDFLAAQRLKQQAEFDLEMLETIGMCPGIENYSRYLTGRQAGEPPPTLFEYLPKDALLFVDESHVTTPQIRAMFKGDYSRKSTLAQYGFRLPSCTDNRPLKFEEWDAMRPNTIYVSATPASWEIERANNVVVEQIVRPTGLLDPVCILRPIETQVDDLLAECRKSVRAPTSACW